MTEGAIGIRLVPFVDTACMSNDVITVSTGTHRDKRVSKSFLAKITFLSFRYEYVDRFR